MDSLGLPWTPGFRSHKPPASCLAHTRPGLSASGLEASAHARSAWPPHWSTPHGPMAPFCMALASIRRSASGYRCCRGAKTMCFARSHPIIIWLHHAEQALVSRVSRTEVQTHALQEISENHVNSRGGCLVAAECLRYRFGSVAEAATVLDGCRADHCNGHAEAQNRAM